MQHDLAYLADILQAADLVRSFVEGITYEEFAGDVKTQAAVIREFEIIGEAAGRVSTLFAVDHPELPWRQMVSMRNRLIHGYDDIDLEVVWEAARTNIPKLIELITPLVAEEE